MKWLEKYSLILKVEINRVRPGDMAFTTGIKTIKLITAAMKP